MRHWTRDHAALLNALRAQTVVPTLYRRLALERFTPGDAEVRRLRDWASSLREDPAWDVLEGVLDRPAAWPAAWKDAVEAGFSPRTDHHHALLFGDFCERFVAASDYTAARWTWRQSIAAWSRVFSSDYPGALFDDVAPRLSEDGPDRDEMLQTMLDPLLDERVRDLREASGLAAPTDQPSLDRPRLRFGWQALGYVMETSARTDDRWGTFARTGRVAEERRQAVSSEVVRRFEALGEEVDLSEAQGEALLGRFRWFADYFDTVGFTESAVTSIVSEVVDTCWALRRIGRDERPEFAMLIRIGAPFNEDLRRRLRTFESAFGHNSRCADFLVFQGEEASDHERRRAIFETGLQVCPGHRNSAMLLSYESLHDARVLLAQTSLTPAVVAMIPGTSRRVDEAVRQAWEKCAEAEEIYPYNETLPEVRDEVLAEADRLGIDLPE